MGYQKGQPLRTLSIWDVKPTPGYGDDAKRAVQHMQAAVASFHKWGQILDEGCATIRTDSQIQAIEYRIQDLKQKGTDSLRATEQLADAYREFAALQSQRLESAGRNGILVPDQRIMTAGASIKFRCSELGYSVGLINECLTQLSNEVDSLRYAHTKKTIWERVKSFVANLLKAVSLLCAALSAFMSVSHFALLAPAVAGVGVTAQQLAGYINPGTATGDANERFNSLVRVLKYTIPTEVLRVKADLSQHTGCLDRLMTLVDHAQVNSYLQPAQAQEAGREWAAQAQILAPYALRSPY